MNFKQRIIEELKLNDLQANTLLKDYVEVCEKLAKEYHELQLQQTKITMKEHEKKDLISELQIDENGNHIRFVNGKKIIQIEEKTEQDKRNNEVINKWRMRSR